MYAGNYMLQRYISRYIMLTIRKTLINMLKSLDKVSILKQYHDYVKHDLPLKGNLPLKSKSGFTKVLSEA